MDIEYENFLGHILAHGRGAFVTGIILLDIRTPFDSFSTYPASEPEFLSHVEFDHPSACYLTESLLIVSMILVGAKTLEPGEPKTVLITRCGVK